MKTFFEILRGVVIGLANIIPGVSGGTMMVSMGIYDTIIGCINSLFKDFKKCIKTLWPYALGMVAGILGLAKLITYLLGTFPLPTNMAFIGLILGGLPMIVRKMKGEKTGHCGCGCLCTGVCARRRTQGHRRRKHGRCCHYLELRSDDCVVPDGCDCGGNDGYSGRQRFDDADAVGIL